MKITRAQVIHGALFLLVALPAFYQIYLLAAAIGHRLAYPYDLEWMEGGLLVHAQRIRDGLGIYGPPSVDFIPYLYTPLYPTLLALFGPSYTVGRVLGVLALLGIASVTAASIVSRRHRHPSRLPAWAGVVLALGLFAAAYPVTKAWYDLVRADTCFLYMVTAGIAGLSRWARSSRGLRGHGKVAAGAVLLALAFFTKQTGIIYVAFGGAIVLVLAWRRAFTYAAVAGAIGLGFVAVFGTATNDWFWIYVSKIHRAHDFNMDRFWGGFARITWQFPIASIAIAVGLAITLATWIVRRRFPSPAFPLVLWSATYAVSIVVGMLGIGTEWSVENAFMPAFLHGAIAAGAAVPAVAGCVRLLGVSYQERHGARAWLPHVHTVAALAVGVALAVSCWRSRWNWRAFVPTAADVTAGDKLVARIRAIDGRVWVPSHPWYAHLAGKTPFVHRMGVKDVTDRKPRPILGIEEAIDSHAFAAIVLDNIDLHDDLQPELATIRMKLRRAYHAAVLLPGDERPRGFSGASVVPESIWVPSQPPKLAADQTLVFDFEDPAWTGWQKSGGAWGYGPVADLLDEHHVIVAGATGHRFAASMTGGHKATGRVTSPPFTIAGTRLTMLLGGGLDATKLRVELVVADAIAGVAAVPTPGGDQLRPVTIDTTAVLGRKGVLRLIDDSETQHLLVDDVILVR